MSENTIDPVTWAARFHEIYERLAPSFGYETRDDTKAFDPTTPNGKLMTAVCGEIIATLSLTQPTAPAVGDEELCDDCPPVGYPTDKTRCLPCPRRSRSPFSSDLPALFEGWWQTSEHKTRSLIGYSDKKVLAFAAFEAAIAAIRPEGMVREAPDYPAVQAAVTRLAAVRGRDAVMGVFERFGVDHAARLSASQWPAAIAALELAYQDKPASASKAEGE